MWLEKQLSLLLLALTLGSCQDEDEAKSVIGFDCPPESSGYFPHPEFCDRFFECRDGKLVKNRLCADGLAFDPEKNPDEDPCDHIHNVKGRCKSRPKLQAPQPGDGYCPRQNGVYPSPEPTECDKFYSCLNGVGSVQQCADGLHFDMDIGTCVWARESTRKGCLSASKRAAAAQPEVKKVQEEQKEGESLPNGFKCPGGKLGIHPALPHPDSCRLYYVCLNGVIPNEAGCTSGLVFNKESAKCDDPRNVPGCENTYESGRKQTSTTSKPTTKPSILLPMEEETVGDLAKLLTLLSNPKLKTFLKPEIANVLDSVDQANEDEDYQEGPIPRQVDPRRKKKRPVEVDEQNDDEPEDELNLGPVPTNRRNVFTSRFIPKVRPVGNLENLKTAETTLVQDKTATESPRQRFKRPLGLKGPNMRKPKPVGEESSDLPELGEEMIKSLLASAADPNSPKPNITQETQNDL